MDSVKESIFLRVKRWRCSGEMAALCGEEAVLRWGRAACFRSAPPTAEPPLTAVGALAMSLFFNKAEIHHAHTGIFGSDDALRLEDLQRFDEGHELTEAEVAGVEVRQTLRQASS